MVVNLPIFLFFTVEGVLLMALLVPSRLPGWRHWLLSGCLLAALLAGNTVLYRAMGRDWFTRHYPLFSHLPALLVFAATSRWRGWQLLFQLLTAVMFCLLTAHIGGLAYGLTGWTWTIGPVMAISAAALVWFTVRHLRPLLWRVFPQLRRGWGLLCLLLAGYYGIVIYLIPGFVGEVPTSTILKPAISLLMVGVYVVMVLLFSSIQREEEQRHNADLFALRLSAVQERMEANRLAEEALRIERHDLRHRLQTAAELVARGSRQEALDLLSAARERLDEAKLERYCASPVLDAVFTSYFRQARQQGVRVEAEISLPERLPVDEAELAIVFANSLENAIHACLALPEPSRRIRCKVICRPGLMFALENACDGTARLDSRGLPVADRRGHGLGTRSITAFCEKYGALCTYRLSEGWFSLRVVL